MPRQIRGLFVLLLVLVSVFVVPSRVHADDSCSLSLSTGSLFIGTTPTMTASITNTGTDPIAYLYIYNSGSGYSMTGISLDGWTASLSDESRATLTDGSLAPGDTLSVPIQVSVGTEIVDLTSLNVQATSLADGNGLVDCGTSNLSVIATTAPVISDVTISDVSDSSAKVSWTTDHAATSSLEYGVTSAYGESKSDSTMTTSHSFTLTGLSANTTYHAKLSGTDGDGFTGSTTDFTFATAAPGLTITETVTVNTTTTTTNTVTIVAPAATPIPDRIAPKITLATKLAAVFSQAPEVSGKVTDAGGLDAIEFSTDGGKNWLPVDQVIQKSPKSLDFTFTPEGLVDGNYSVVIRARDVSGNQQKTKPVVMVIDRLSPQIGGLLYSVGPFPLRPALDGALEMVADLPLKITFSAVGGPTNLELVLDDTKLPVTQNRETGLWSCTLSHVGIGEHTIRWSAIDGAGNTGSGKLGSLRMIAPGKIRAPDGTPASASLSVLVFDPLFGDFVLWNGAQFGQPNPQETDETGAYHLALPPGRYYLRATNSTGASVRTTTFSLSALTFITQDLRLRPRSVLSLGPLQIPLPDFGNHDVSVFFPETSIVTTETSSQIGSEFPDLDEIGVDVLSLRGKASIISLTSSWVPTIGAEMELLSTLVPKKNMRALTIMQQESKASIEVFAARGEYATDVVADPDGVIGKALSVTTLPTHYFVDRKGIVTKVLHRTLKPEDISGYVVQ